MAPDFTVTDTHGNVHNLYTITASGKYVQLALVDPGSSPSQNRQALVNELYQTYGCNGQNLAVLTIGWMYNTPNAAMDAYQDTYGGSFAHSPVAGSEGGSASLFSGWGGDLWALPTYCLIGPDNRLLADHAVWPVDEVQDFVSVFPPGSNIQPAACPVGIEEASRTMASRAFPVPTAGPLTVEASLPASGSVTLEVIDALGRTVLADALGLRPAGALTHRMDLGALGEGQYALRVLVDGTPSATQRLVVAR